MCYQPNRLMLAIGLRRWCINITITILDIIHVLSFIYNTTFRRLNTISVFRWNLFSWAQQIVLLSGPETEISSIYWAQRRNFHMKTEAEFSLRNVVLQIKDSTMDVQNCDSYINIPSSQTYR
jgi:hypothetical protein